MRKGGIETTKNYLEYDEIEQLNRLVTQFLQYAELQTRRRKVIHLDEPGIEPDWYHPPEWNVSRCGYSKTRRDDDRAGLVLEQKLGCGLSVVSTHSLGVFSKFIRIHG